MITGTTTDLIHRILGKAGKVRGESDDPVTIGSINASLVELSAKDRNKVLAALDLHRALLKAILP